MILRRVPIVLSVIAMGALAQQPSQPGGNAAHPALEQPGPPVDWNARLELSPLGGRASDGPVKLQVCYVKQESVPDSASFGDRKFMDLGFSVDGAGTVSSSASWGIFDDSVEFGGGGDYALLPEVYDRIRTLAGQLPDDKGIVPPRNHKISVQVFTAAKSFQATYDASGVPGPLLEIFRLAKFDFKPLVPTIAPDSQAPTTDNLPDPHTLAVSRDGKLRVFHAQPASPYSWIIDVSRAAENAASTAKVDAGWDDAEVVDADGKPVARIPSSPQIDNRYNVYRAAWFTPNHQYLVLSTSVPDLRIWNTSTWKQVEQVPDIPQSALDFEPSPDWTHAIVVFPSGEVDLWDVAQRRRISRVDFGASLHSVAWSPDGSRVAVVTAAQSDQYDNVFSHRHLRVWRVHDGRQDREFLAFDMETGDFGVPFWSTDGKYLLDETGLNNSVGIWNASSGRYRGALFADQCRATVPPQVDGNRLYMVCDGNHPALSWDLRSAIQTVVSFEDALPRYQ